MPTSPLNILKRIRTDFEYFVFRIFSRSFDEFVEGDHIKNVCSYLQNNRKTLRVSAKDHFKSTSLYAFIMWRIAADFDRSIEAHYFSYKESMAAYHMKKLKEMIARNPFFDDCRDLKPNAESVLKYSWGGGKAFSIDPLGLLEFKRGIHCDDVYVDDPFQDPENPMILTDIDKINRVLTTNIMDMPRRYFHIVGTPQTKKDFFFDGVKMRRFARVFQPAIVNETQKIALWPEWMSWQELMERKSERGEKVFNQEYLCSPVYTENSFFRKEQITGIVNPALECLDYKTKHEIAEDVIGGFDIGKKSHPSHLSVFKLQRENKRTRRIQIFQKFLDNYDYSDQIDFLKECIENFGILYLWYDNTRGEFESFEERGELPAAMKPVTFGVKTKNAMAVAFDKAVTNNDIELLIDQRQVDQIMQVTNDLQAVETPQGHGDSFWSTAMTFNFEDASELRFL